MATHSSSLAWEFPWTEEPGGLQPMGIAKSCTRLSDFHSLTQFGDLLVDAWTEEPGGLQSMESLRVGHD